MLLVNGREKVLFVRRVLQHATLLCACLTIVWMQRQQKYLSNHTRVPCSLIFSSHSFKLRAHKERERGFFFFTFNRQNELAKERWGTKDLKLYPVSTVLHVSQCPGPVIHSSFPYLSLLRMKDKQKPNSSWLAWCFSIKALLLSRPSLHPVPTSLQPWPYIIFQTQCFSSSSLFSSSLFFPTSPRIKHS